MRLSSERLRLLRNNIPFGHVIEHVLGPSIPLSQLQRDEYGR